MSLAWAQTLKILLLGVQHGDVWVCVHAALSCAALLKKNQVVDEEEEVAEG